MRLGPSYFKLMFLIFLGTINSNCYLINRIPSPILNNKTPFEFLINKSQPISNFKILDVFVMLQHLDTKTNLLLRLHLVFSWYIFLHKRDRSCMILPPNNSFSRDVVFDEIIFPFLQTESHSPPFTNKLSSLFETVYLSVSVPHDKLPSTFVLPLKIQHILFMIIIFHL